MSPLAVETPQLVGVRADQISVPFLSHSHRNWQFNAIRKKIFYCMLIQILHIVKSESNQKISFHLHYITFFSPSLSV